MALPAVVPLNAMGSGFTHSQFPSGHDGRIRPPVIGTVTCHVPRCEALDQLLQGCSITTPTLPVQDLPCRTIQSVPDPEFAAFLWRTCHISSSSMRPSRSNGAKKYAIPSSFLDTTFRCSP